MATTGLIREARELLAQVQHVVPDDDPDLDGVSSAELEARCEAALAAYRKEREGQPHPMDGMTTQERVDWLEHAYFGHPNRHRR
jgi:hypothetical protein